MEKQSELLFFIQNFNSKEACFQFLTEYKWGKGYQCIRCGCQESIKGKTPYHRRCRRCYYDESCTANTLFHQLKFSITKAFAIIFQIAVMKKGLSSCEIHRLYGIHQETAWFFRRKVQLAMSAELNEEKTMYRSLTMVNSTNENKSKESINDTLVRREIRTLSNHGNNSNYNSNGRSKLKKSQPGILTMLIKNRKFNFAREEKRGKRLVHFVDLWHKHLPLFWSEFRYLNLRRWLIGTHHRVTIEHLQYYFNEFFCRNLFRLKLKQLPTTLIENFVKHHRRPYASLIAT
jgi:hypothetical protein